MIRTTRAPLEGFTLYPAPHSLRRHLWGGALAVILGLAAVAVLIPRQAAGVASPAVSAHLNR